MKRQHRYRTLWISDVHLGTREAKAPFLLDFLRHNVADRLYLVGDIFDGWALRRSWYWPASHNDVLQVLLRWARSGTEITYVPGNHDEAARTFPGLDFGGIVVQQQAVHETADGRRILILHGDEFDGVIRHARWLSLMGSWAYSFILKLNRHFNRARRWCDLPYWSLSAYLKYKTKRAVQFIADFERAVAREARQQAVDGVVCGHIHHAEMRTIDGVLYANTGDWVESCTALAEHQDGRLEIIRWVPSAHEGVALPATTRGQGDGYAGRDVSVQVAPTA
jgi:UDP-2,3-diacylglucosamine pyrophosphatase LpxH